MTESPLNSTPVALEAVVATRPVYWSVRRELWENRSLYLAPAIVASFVLFGFMISLITLPRRMNAVLALDAAKERATVALPFSVAAGLTLLTAFIVGVFYCVDALNGERRDRSILFWKSLPVSDRTTVLTKASIPLVVLPLYIFAIIVVVQLIMLMMSTVVLLGSPKSLVVLWTNVKFVQSTLALFYSLIAIALWHAPIYGWFLMISAWARRATLLWAMLPALAISMLEKMAFNTSHFSSLMGYRVIGWFNLAFIEQSHGTVVMDPLTALTPGRFLTSAGLWLGLIFAAAFFAAAVRLRHNREPI